MFRFRGTSASALSREDLIDVYLDMRPMLERVIARRTGSLALAADLAQEIFFKIDAVKAILSTRSDAERYFIRVATNAALDYMKIEARRRIILQEDANTAVPAIVPSPERVAFAREDLRRVEDALAELPEKCRMVFIMSRFKELTHAQIAAELGVSVSLVEKYVVRAMLHCRARLSD